MNQKVQTSMGDDQPSANFNGEYIAMMKAKIERYEKIIMEQAVTIQEISDDNDVMREKIADYEEEMY